MNQQAKAHLTGLNNLLEDEDDFIVIIKNKAYYKSNSYEKNEDGRWEPNNNIDVLRQAGLKISDEEEPKKKKRTPNPTQLEISEKIKTFFNAYVCDDESEKEDFGDVFVTLHEEKDRRVNYLRDLLPAMKGTASSFLYQSFIELVLLIIKYKEKFDDEENEVDGEEMLRVELGSVITTKEKPSTFIKKAKNFHFIAARLKKNSWKDCNVAPSSWRDITSETWSNLLIELNLNE